MRTIWIVKTAEPLPCDGEVRLLRMGLVADILSGNAENDIIWWSSTFDHYRKRNRCNEGKNISIRNNYQIRLIQANASYKSNISFGRLLHQFNEAKSFYSLAQKEKMPDIIICPMPTLEMTYFASKFAKKNNIPILVDIRDMFPDMYVDFVKAKYRPIVRLGIIPYKLMLRKALRNATALIATSEKFLKWGASYANRDIKDTDRVYYVSYPDNTIGKNTIEFWKSFGLSQEDFICCFFGKFGHTVDLETVMRAAVILKENSKVKLVICGEGEKLSEYRDILGDCDNVIFPGWVDKDQIYTLGQLSSIGLLAYKPGKNYEDSMPNKFCEYLALGQALMVEPEGMMLELATRHNCGMYFKDEYELAENIKRLEADKELLDAMKANSRKLYLEKFCSEVVYSDYAKYIEHFIDEGKNEI